MKQLNDFNRMKMHRISLSNFFVLFGGEREACRIGRSFLGEGGGEGPERSQTRGTGNMDRESQVLTPFVHKLRIQYE